MKIRNDQYLVGRGVGGIFRGIVKFFKPLLKFLSPVVTKAVKSKTGQKLINQVKKSAVKAAIKTSSDVISGENVKNSVSNNLNSASEEVLASFFKKKKKKKKKLSRPGTFNFFE